MKIQSEVKKAVCLLSGGLDSTTALYAAREQGFSPIALSIDYGQLHAKELTFAKRTTGLLNIPHDILSFSMPWGGSSLLDPMISMPLGRKESEMQKGIPSTYVPARNSVFLSLAASCAEAREAGTIFIGANVLDYSGYPDCRPEYFEAFEQMLEKGTKAGAEGRKIKIEAPLLNLNKKQIVELGHRLGVPFDMTWSCYQGGQAPCGQCDSCLLRAKGFQEAGIQDPLATHAVPADR